MRSYVYLGAGVVLGFALSTVVGKQETKLVRKDSVTLKRSDLAHVTHAISLLQAQPIARSYPRYESNDGRVSFECPSFEGCNLSVNAANRVTASEPQVKAVGLRANISDLNDQKERSLFDELGLMDGDVIKGINGKPIASPDEALSAFEELKKLKQDGKKIEVSVRHLNGTEEDLSL